MRTVPQSAKPSAPIARVTTAVVATVSTSVAPRPANWPVTVAAAVRAESVRGVDIAG